MYCSQKNPDGFNTVITYPIFESFVLSISPAYENDDEFINLVRNLFTFTSLRPPPPQYKMSHGSHSNPTPTAKQVFGDFISWNQSKSAKELSQSERVTKTVSKFPALQTYFL